MHTYILLYCKQEKEKQIQALETYVKHGVSRCLISFKDQVALDFSISLKLKNFCEVIFEDIP